MTEIKLPKLPDRTPVKITIILGADLHHALQGYADLYASTYGTPEQIVDLIPFMLEAFLRDDKAFMRSAKK